MLKYIVKLDAKQLRESDPAPDDFYKIKRNPIYFVLDEILDTYNIGSMFRLADAVAAQKIYLCGRMLTPPYHRIRKSSVGTDKWVPWEHYKSTLEVVKKLKNEGVQIVTIEQSVNSIPYTEFEPKFPVALVLGHETAGVNEAVISISDATLELPMYGVNKSFNVWGTASVVAYSLLEKLK